MNFEQLSKAELTDIEVADILGVSRMAIFNWKRKRTNPHKLLAGRVAKFDSLVKVLLDSEKLPLKVATPAQRKEKVQKIKAVFDKHTSI